jgi:hypothetical protein
VGGKIANNTLGKDPEDQKKNREPLFIYDLRVIAGLFHDVWGKKN